MAISNNIFVTDTKKPPVPTVTTVQNNISVKEVAALPPRVKQALEKASGICIATDAALDKARSLVRTSMLQKLFGGGLLSKIPSLPVGECSIGNMLGKAVSVASTALSSMQSDLSYLESKFALATDAETLCRNLEELCPICPDWPDVLSELNAARLANQFADILDKIISFGDPKLLEMFLHCPEFLLKSSVNQLNAAARQMRDAGQLNMLKTLITTANPKKLIDLKATIIATVAKTPSEPATATDLAEITAAIGWIKKDLVTISSDEFAGVGEVYNANSLAAMASTGTEAMASEIPPTTQLMAQGVVAFLASSSSTSTGVSGTSNAVWVDETGYTHINDYSKLDDMELSNILASNRLIRLRKARKAVIIHDVRSNAGTPINLNGCEPITELSIPPFSSSSSSSSSSSCSSSSSSSSSSSISSSSSSSSGV